MWQQLIAVGNVGRDAEMKYTADGVAVCNFTLAVNKWRGKGENRQQETTWINVVLWREKAETAGQYVKSGMKLMVIGEVKAKAYMDKNGKPAASLELTANEFKFLDSKGDSDPAAPPRSARQPQRSAEPDDDPSLDIPF